MRVWEKTCGEVGAVLACGSVICCGEPDEDGVRQCEALGEALAL